MKTKICSRSGFPDSRALFSCVAASWIATATLLGFFHAETPSKASQKTLTFAERVAYQRAVEEVYWRHRIWPKERPDPKPSLDAVMSQPQLETKVTDYLRNSQALEDYWQRPITAEQLQAEMDRMAQHTRQPEVLRELFEVLGNDPFVIAECLARPVLAERLVRKLKNEEKVATIDSIDEAVQVNRPYQLPAIAGASGDCIDDTWTATSTINALLSEKAIRQSGPVAK